MCQIDPLHAKFKGAKVNIWKSRLTKGSIGYCETPAVTRLTKESANFRGFRSLFRLKNVIVLLPPDYKSKIFRLYVEVKVIPVNNNLVLANKYFVLLTCDILRSFDLIFRDWGKTLGRVLYNACSYLRVTAKFEKNNKFRVFWCIIY